MSRLINRFMIILLLIIFVFGMGMDNRNSYNFVIPVLMYHNLDSKIRNSVTIHPKQFRKQMLGLKRMGYTPVTVEDIASNMENKKGLPAKPILITFDDGYLSNYTYAYPMLKELKVKATFFVVANECGKTPWKIPHFTWKQAKEMYDSGLIDIQSHSYDSHKNIIFISFWGRILLKPVLTTRIVLDGKIETEEQYKKRVRQDLLQSKLLIEKNVGNKVISLAYPLGGYNKKIECIAKETGFKMAFTAKCGVNYMGDNPYQLKRINISGNDSVRALLDQYDGKHYKLKPFSPWKNFFR